MMVSVIIHLIDSLLHEQRHEGRASGDDGPRR